MPQALADFISTQTDYLLFAGGAVVLFTATALGVARWRKGARFPARAWLLAAAFVIASWWPVQNAGDDARANIERLVSTMAPTYAIELERLGHSQISPETPADDPRYLEIISAILKWQKANPFAHDIYTIRKNPDGKNLFIVDAETDYNHDGKFDGETEERTAIGEPFDEQDAGLEAALAGAANFNPAVVEDEWGRWVGAWAPILGPGGKIDAVVGVDFAARDWEIAGASARLTVLTRCGLVLALIALGGAALALLKADIRRRILAEQQLLAADERMQLTIRQMPVAFIEWDTDARARLWNPAAERIFGFKSDEVLGKPVFPWIVAPGAKEHVDKLWTSLIGKTGGSHSINDNITKDGRTIICEWFNTPLVGPDGTVRGVFSITQDLTERVSLERHVQQAQRMNAVGQLAAGVAHDFNNILTIITGHAGLLLGHSGLPADARPDIERIEEAALRASSLTRQLLAFSKQQAIFPRPLHLGEVVQNTAAMLARVLGPDTSLNVRIDTESAAIEADPAMLDQVITNLVLNARDSMPRGGSITITVERIEIPEDAIRIDPDAHAGPAIRMSIADTGVGIPPENLTRIFEPFFTTKLTGQGTGLGLSVAHGVIKQHHGWITVESTVGKGTTFHLHFPPTDKIPEPGALQRPTPGPAPVGARRTILLVEDETMLRDLARLILERSGYHVLTADHGPAALDIWRQQKDTIDLLLTDMVMPGGITGRELSLRILAERPGLPVIYASGYSLELTAPDFHETDRQIFLPKPYLTDQLLTSVQKCLAAAG